MQAHPHLFGLLWIWFMRRLKSNRDLVGVPMYHILIPFSEHRWFMKRLKSNRDLVGVPMYHILIPFSEHRVDCKAMECAGCVWRDPRGSRPSSDLWFSTGHPKTGTPSGFAFVFRGFRCISQHAHSTRSDGLQYMAAHQLLCHSTHVWSALGFWLSMKTVSPLHDRSLPPPKKNSDGSTHKQ